MSPSFALSITSCDPSSCPVPSTTPSLAGGLAPVVLAKQSAPPQTPALLMLENQPSPINGMRTSSALPRLEPSHPWLLSTMSQALPTVGK